MNNENAIRVLEEFKIIDDWTIVHLPDMEDAVDVAIEALKNEINCVKCQHYTERETDTGIKGVCKMDTAHKGDLISRQAAIDAMWKALYAYEEELEQKFIQDQDVDYADYPVSRMWVQNGHDVCHKAILSLPSAPDSRQRGEWSIEECECIYGTKYILTCSECGESVSVTENALPYEKYCRNCGARMRGGEDE